MRRGKLFWGTVVLTVGLVSCGGAKSVYLHTGERDPITVTPKSRAQVRLSEGEYKQALGWLGHDVYAGSSSLQAAHDVFDAPSIEVTIQEVEQTYQVELIAAYRRWCERKGTPGDCLKLLGRGTWLTGEAKQTLAMAFAMDSVCPETADALRGMVDPMAVQAMILTSMTVYLGLLVLPEPTSKIVAAHLTAALIAYLGVDTVWELIQGWRELHKLARNAYSFDEIRGVGQRFGGIVGRNAARVFVMLTTAAIGSTIGLAGKLPSLPGSGQAAMVAANQAGFELSAVGSVTSVTVAADGAISIALPAGAVAMAGNTQGTTRTSSTSAGMRNRSCRSCWSRYTSSCIAKFTSSRMAGWHRSRT